MSSKPAINTAGAHALAVDNDSMAPRYHSGDVIVAAPGVEPLPGKGVVVRLKDGRRLINLLGWKQGGAVQLLSVNDSHPPITLRLDEIERIDRIEGCFVPDPQYLAHHGGGIANGTSEAARIAAK